MKSGEQIRIRPVRVSDEDALQDLLYGLSDESTFFRFFGHTKSHPRQEVLRMVELDDARSQAFVACALDTDELLGIARTDLEPRSGAAELAVTVTDAWQGKGVGSRLLDHLLRGAATAGVRTVKAYVMPGNRRMQQLLRSVGFQCTSEPSPEPLCFHRVLREERGSV